MRPTPFPLNPPEIERNGAEVGEMVLLQPHPLDVEDHDERGPGTNLPVRRS
jgi:hypothetical protein